MIGTHINSELDKLLDESNRVYKSGGQIIQMFVNLDPDKTKTIYNKLNQLLIDLGMKCIIHISYTINCSQNWDNYSWWIKQFIIEIEQANKLNALAVVVHLGKQLDLTIEEAINNMYMSLLYVHNQTKKYQSVKILIETSTGQGSEICYNMENLAHFYNKLSKHKNEEVRNRFGICLDTCHIFSAGYDISTVPKCKIYLDTFNKLIGLEHIKLIHLNDSKKEVGSHVDRHENIGKGFIGKKSLVYFCKLFHRLEVPIILEVSDSSNGIKLCY